MKCALGPRREIGIRIIFNVLELMTNPANAKYQLISVYDPNLTEIIANALKKLKNKNVFVVYRYQIDEITITGKTKIAELKNNAIKTYFIKMMILELNK